MTERSQSCLSGGYGGFELAQGYGSWGDHDDGSGSDKAKAKSKARTA